MSNVVLYQSEYMQYNLFHETKFIFENSILKCFYKKLSKSIIIIITIAIAHLFSVDKANQLITARRCLSIPPENIKKPLGFLMFSRDIDQQNRAVMS